MEIIDVHVKTAGPQNPKNVVALDNRHLKPWNNGELISCCTKPVLWQTQNMLQMRQFWILEIIENYLNYNGKSELHYWPRFATFMKILKH